MTFGKDFFEEKLGWTKVYDGGYNSDHRYASPEKPEEINKDFNPDEFSAVPYVPESDENYLTYVPEGTKSIVFDMQHEQEVCDWECDGKIPDLKGYGLMLRKAKSFADAFNIDVESYVVFND